MLSLVVIIFLVAWLYVGLVLFHCFVVDFVACYLVILSCLEAEPFVDMISLPTSPA